MKKIFSFAAMLFAAMTINAQSPIAATCAEAAAAMPAQSGSETEDVYAVTGYVTNTNGAISPSRTDPTIDQQTFFIDDVKGSQKTVQGYWCNLPGHEALNVGDKITVTGKIINYNNTPEIKNGDVVILERATVVIDTIDASVCEALEEGSSLNAGDYSADVFRVYGRLKGQTIEISNGKVELIEKSGQEEIIIEANVAEATTAAMALANGASSEDRYAITGYVDSIAIAYSDQYNNISFFMTDDMAQPTYTFEAYRVKCTADQAAQLGLGAKVKVTAAIQHYYKEADQQKELPEINLAETVAGGELEIIEPVQGIENLVLTEKAQKVVVDGVVYIIRDNKLFNALGTQVK